MRVLILQILQRKPTGIRHRPRRMNGMGPIRKQTTHLRGWFQIPFRIGFQQKPRGLNRHAFADAGHHILQRSARRCVVKNIIGGKDRQTVGFGQSIKTNNPPAVVAAIEVGGGDMAHGW